MKTKTSKVIKILFVLPVVALLLFGFSETKVVEKPIEIQNHSQIHLSKKNSFKVNLYNTLDKDVERMKYIYSLMSDKQKKNVVPYQFPNLEKNQQEGATRKQMKEYEALAKKYNTMLSEAHFTIQIKDVERLKYLYSLMSKKQKADAEPFPNFPEPPPAPTNPEEVKHKPNGRTITPHTKKFYAGGKDSISSAGFRSPPEVIEVTPPPVPPNPLNHIIAMAKQGATFYYRGRKISSNKAIALIKKNPDLSVSSESKNGNPPVVKISKHL